MKTKQTIHKTAGGCYLVGKRYFANVGGALKEATKEECSRRSSGEDTYAVDTDDLNAVLDEIEGTTYRVNTDDFVEAAYAVINKRRR